MRALGRISRCTARHIGNRKTLSMPMNSPFASKTGAAVRTQAASRAVLGVLALAVLIPALAHAEALRLVTGELPPYATRERPDHGIALDIVRKQNLVTLPDRPARMRLASAAESAGQPSRKRPLCVRRLPFWSG